MSFLRDTYYTAPAFYGQDSQKKIDVRSCAADPFDYKCQICKLENEIFLALGSLPSETHYISEMFTEQYFGDTYKIDRFNVLIEAETDYDDFTKILNAYHDALDAFDGSYEFIRKPDEDKNFTEISLIGNFDPVDWQRYQVTSKIGSRSGLKKSKKYYAYNIKLYYIGSEMIMKNSVGEECVTKFLGSREGFHKICSIDDSVSEYSPLIGSYGLQLKLCPVIG